MNYFGDNRWLVFILPGFVSLFVASFISDFPDIRDSQLPVVYVALTALSIILPIAVFHAAGVVRGVSYQFEKLVYNPYFVSLVFLVSLLLGLFFGIAHTTDYISRGLRYYFGRDIILTSSKSDPFHVLLKNIYNEKFMDGHPYIRMDETNRYSRIEFSDKGTSYEGVVTAFSESKEKPQLYLSPACIVQGKAVVPIKGPGVWLNLERVSSIQFINSKCSECAAATAVVSGRIPNQTCPFVEKDRRSPGIVLDFHFNLPL